MSRPLNPRQERFARELALQAIRGEPESPLAAARAAGYSAKSAKVYACRLAQDPRVRAIVDPEVAKAAKQLAAEFDVKRDDILRELAHMGFARLSDVVQWGDAGYYVRPPSEIIERGHAALQAVEITEDRIGEDVVRRRTKVRLHGKVEALLAAARLAGHLTDDKAPTAVAGVQIIVNGGPTGLEVRPQPKATNRKRVRAAVEVGA